MEQGQPFCVHEERYSGCTWMAEGKDQKDWIPMTAWNRLAHPETVHLGNLQKSRAGNKTCPVVYYTLLGGCVVHVAALVA